MNNMGNRKHSMADESAFNFNEEAEGNGGQDFDDLAIDLDRLTSIMGSNRNQEAIIDRVAEVITEASQA